MIVMLVWKIRFLISLDEKNISFEYRWTDTIEGIDTGWGVNKNSLSIPQKS